MRVNSAHIAVRAVTGRSVSVAVFDANAANRTDCGRQQLLAQLTAAARNAGLRVEQSALAYSEHGRIKYFETPTLVDHLAAQFGPPGWTHSIEH